MQQWQSDLQSRWASTHLSQEGIKELIEGTEKNKKMTKEKFVGEWKRLGNLLHSIQRK